MIDGYDSCQTTITNSIDKTCKHIYEIKIKCIETLPKHYIQLSKNS